jgi:hypothetical protein
MAKNEMPVDFKLAVHITPGDTYEWSKVLLARARFDGTMQLLTAAWGNVLGYGRQELAGKTLGQLLRSAKPEAVVSAILEERHSDPVDLTLRCRNGAAKRFRLHRRVDDYLRQVFLVAEEKPSSLVHPALAPADDYRASGTLKYSPKAANGL